MPIRFAHLEDIPALVDLGKRMHQITRFRKFAYDASKVSRSLVDILQRGSHKYVVLLAEGNEKEIVGGLVGALEKPLFSDQLVATVAYYIVLPEKRMGGYGIRLLRAFEQWAKNRKVVEIYFGVNSGVDYEKVEKLAQKIGYRKTGENYVREAL